MTKEENARRIRLLMVDDEEDFLMSTSQALSRRGIDVEVAPNGISALEKVDQQEFDVVVLDVRMPDIDGIQVFNEIHQKFPDLPVIILTGYGSITDGFRSARNGVADYLFKPVEIEELASKIRKAVRDFESRKPIRTGHSAQAEQTEPIRVLLVDDEVSFLDSMRSVLRRRNMVVATAENGADALAHLAESLVDVVVLDLKMPGMDGLEVLKCIKARFPSAEVIILTGHPSVETALEVIRLGATEYLKKPPEISELVDAIRRLYETRQRAILDRQQKLIEEIRRRYPD